MLQVGNAGRVPHTGQRLGKSVHANRHRLPVGRALSPQPAVPNLLLVLTMFTRDLPQGITWGRFLILRLS